MKKVAIVIGTDYSKEQIDSQSIDALSGASVKEGKVLRTTTTIQIALRMKQIISGRGIQVDLLPASANQIDVSSYDLVIIGTGIYGRQSHPDVKAFVNSHKDLLAGQKVAVFSVSGTMGTENAPKREKARKAYTKTVSEGLRPVSTAMFAGMFPDSGSFGNWIGGLVLGGAKPGDHRNWQEIQAWTESLLE